MTLTKHKPKWNLLGTDSRYFLISGGRGCFCFDQLVETENGAIPIGKIKKGDSVLTYNEKTKNKEYKRVVNTFEYSNEQIIIIKLKNGTVIKVTENHKFYHDGVWLSVKDLLSLYYGKMESNREV